MWLHFRIFVVNADYIETPRDFLAQSAEIVARHAGQFAALVAVYGGFRGFYVVGGARLHLDEAEYALIPADQVDFSPAARTAIVTSHHYVAMLPQVEVGLLFAPAAGAMVPGRTLITAIGDYLVQ